MANCSSAYGAITLTGEWTDEMLVCMNKVKNEWGSWYYNIEADGDFSRECLSQTFFGCGRWAFDCNLRYLEEWTKGECGVKPDLDAAYKLLTAEMQKRGSCIDFTYSDEEPGCLLLCDGEAQFRAENGMLIKESASDQHYEFCWKDYLERGFGGTDSLEELIDDIFNLLHIAEAQRNDRRDVVRTWAMDNTSPGASACNIDDGEREDLAILIGA